MGRWLVVVVLAVGALVVLAKLLPGGPIARGGGDTCERDLDHVRGLYRAEVAERQAAEESLASCQSDLGDCE